MAGQLQVVTIAAPGFYGLNTQESGITISSGFALEAINCVIDKFGRIGSRKGWNTFTSDVSGSPQFTGTVRAIAQYTKSDGTLEVIFTAGSKIYKADDSSGSVTEITGSATITDDDWQIITYNNHAVFVQEGHNPVYYNGASNTYQGYSSPPFTQPTCGASCFNRVWVGEGSTVYWSKILEPQSMTGTGTGQINMREIFGEDDDVVAISAYNNRLVVFGRRNIAFFAGAEDPTGTGFAMSDHIKGIGCIARDSVQNVGTDIVFLSSEGVRSLGRTIQEKSSPIGDVSKNIRDDIVQYSASESEYRIKGIYSPNDAFYLLTLPATGYTYCFDMRAQLQDGSRRVTVWTDINPSAYAVKNDNTLLLGQANYVGKYDSFSDNGSFYRMSYYTNYIDFGNAAVESILKKIRLAIIGATNQDAALKWAFDYNIDYTSTSFVLSEGTSSEYNINEFGIDTLTAATETPSQSSTTITDVDSGVHYSLDFSATLQTGYEVGITVYLDSDTYYYNDQDVGETRTETTLYFPASVFPSEYSSGIVLDNISLNIGGKGAVAQIGIEADIRGGALSIQKMDIFAKNGKLVS